MDKEQKPSNPVNEAASWLSSLKLAKKEDEKWIERSKKIVRRYKDERQGWSDNTKRYNILWANIQTIFPALYGKTPRADVQRRFKDQDPVGRTSSQILERALQYEIDHYGDFDAAIKAAVLDRLLPGRGVAWVRFETKDIAQPEIVEEATLEAAPDYEYECTPVDYVYWEDFRCSPARVWEEVTWVARRVYMSRQDVIDRFGEEAKDVPLTHEPIGLDELKTTNKDHVDAGDLKKAQVWEIWDKPSKTVYWVAEGYHKLLDKKEDPYGLDCFWPCPKPLYSTQTNDTIVPVPDYSMYQDQADELDKVTNRIAMLVEACKVVGVYDASQTNVQRMLSEGINNTLIPVDTWAALAEKGGIRGVVDFLPLDMVLTALAECYRAREQSKQVIYEITGLSDIIRGASVASETATAQQIKSQYASLRLRRLQTDVAMFASEILRIKAQLMCDLYSPRALVEMSGIEGTNDAQFIEPAIQLLKSEPARNYRIEVASDSLVEMDYESEKATRMEFLQSAGTFLEKAIPAAERLPELAPLMAEMLLYTVRSFKGGRPMEAAFDSAMAQLTAPKQPEPPPPNPEEIRLQGQMQLEQMKIQAQQAADQQSAQVELMKEQMRLQMQDEAEQRQAERDMMLEQMRMQMQGMLTRFVETIRAETELNKAQISASTVLTPAQDNASDMAIK